MMQGINLFEVIDLIPRVGLLITPVAAGVTTYIVCEVLGFRGDEQWFITGAVFFTVLLIVLAIYLFRWLFRRKKGDKLEDGLAGSAGDTAALRAQWKDSVKKLKGTAIAGGGSRALAALPWFVIIGAPASGKSTLLRQSGIDFPVGDAAIRGLQGTRNCDWWFSNVGVFLDTAGRYISDSSAAEWGEFLDLVRKHRTGAPIHGVIVTLPAPELLSRSEEARELDARRLRARLDELIDHLGVNFPVWIVLTKVDLIGGFTEFYGHADAATRAQIIGWTAEQGEGGRFDLGAFSKRFKAMTHRLREMRPALLSLAPLRDRPAAFAFPDEFAEIEEPLSRMLQRIFEPNVFQETPLFRGLYVTSATQQGSPLQRAASRIRELLGAPQVDADASGSVVKNAYFVKDLMHERIVADQSMTWTTKQEIERGKNRRLGINLIGASVGVALFLILCGFGIKSAKGLERVQSDIKQSVGDAGTSGSVGRCAALRRAAWGALPDPSANLGLSRQLDLRKRAGERQTNVYRNDILMPLFEGWAEGLRDADTSHGVDELIALYEDFLTVEALLQRAVDPTRMPPSADNEEADPSPEDGDDGDDGDAPPEGDPAPPAGFFTDEERMALERRDELLYRKRIIANRNREKGVQSLLESIWHNRGCAGWFEDEQLREVRQTLGDPVGDPPSTCAKWAVDGGEAVHAAFRAALGAYVATAAEAIRNVSDVQKERKEMLGDRVSEFSATSETVRDHLARGKFNRDDLVSHLQDLADAAAGRTAPEGDSDGPSTAPKVTQTVAGAVSRIERLREREGGAPPGLSGDLDDYDVLVKWQSAQTGGASEVEAQLSALNALEKLLAEQREICDTKRFLPSAERLPAKGADDLDVAMEKLRESELRLSLPWFNEVRPHLAALSGKTVAEYGEDPSRWGLGVENILPTMIRDRLFQEFLKENSRRDGAFTGFAENIVERIENDKTPKRKDVANALERLIRPHDEGDGERGSEWPLTDERKAEAIERARGFFGEALEAVERQWTQRCASVRLKSPRAHWAFLSDWLERTPAVRQDFQTAWDDWSLPSGLDKSPAARELWNGSGGGTALSVVDLQQKFSFYGEGFDDVYDVVAELSSLQGVEPSKGLAEIAKALGIPRAAPPWATIKSDLAAAGGLGGKSITDLPIAVAAAEDEIVETVVRHFDARWANVRKQVLATVGSTDPAQRAAARKSLDELVAELRVMFGPLLNYEPGKRLKVAPNFPLDWSAATGGAFVPKEFTVELMPLRIPSGEAAGVGYPFIRLEHIAAEGEVADRTWEPNAGTPLRILWKPGTALRFTIWLVNDQDNSKRIKFREWEGPSALLKAIEAGGGVGEKMSWTGEDDAAGMTATFSLDAKDPGAIRNLLRPPKTDATAELPPNCLETMERP